MGDDDLGFIHLRFKDEKVIEGYNSSERVCLICTVNDSDITVEIPIVR